MQIRRTLLGRPRVDKGAPRSSRCLELRYHHDTALRSTFGRPTGRQLVLRQKLAESSVGFGGRLLPVSSSRYLTRRHLLAVVFTFSSFGLASCSSGPSEADKAVCSAAASVLTAPPTSGYAVNLRTIKGGEASRDSRLAAASRAWAEAVNRQEEQPSVNHALVQVEMACMRLGIWQVHQ